MSNKKIAVILFNLGGPDKIESVKPFLFNLFNDKAIISLPWFLRYFLAKFISIRCEKKTQKIYAQIGGKSPLLEITRSQAYSLEKKLSHFGNFKVFVCMRYWHPMSDEVALQVENYQPDEIVFLPLYPQFSSSTTGSSFEDFEKKLSKNSAIVKKVDYYPVEPEFILSHARLIKQEILKKYDDNLSDFRILFSAHGLPQRLIDKGDPYVSHIEKTAFATIDKLGEIFGDKKITRKNFDFKVCYQSKVGPLKWTSPSLDQEILRAAMDKKTPVIVPIAFVSDHLETLFELDINYKNRAKILGIENYLRVPALNVDGHFINSLAEICKRISSL
ncbi:MAG TPA: ferrochelatase [Rickettsiales bacterium]|nr:ferrochelatase [Rickettsiales bacterium]